MDIYVCVYYIHIYLHIYAYIYSQRETIIHDIFLCINVCILCVWVWMCICMRVNFIKRGKFSLISCISTWLNFSLSFWFLRWFLNPVPPKFFNSNLPIFQIWFQFKSLYNGILPFHFWNPLSLVFTFHYWNLCLFYCQEKLSWVFKNLRSPDLICFYFTLTDKCSENFIKIAFPDK